jgi:hypothetical protein
MPECDFVDLVVDVLEVHMPKFIGIYRTDEMSGKAWTSDVLKDHIHQDLGLEALQSSVQFR